MEFLRKVFRQLFRRLRNRTMYNAAPAQSAPESRQKKKDLSTIEGVEPQAHGFDANVPTPSPLPETPQRHGIHGRDPYFIQIGFDFGTAYCKCVCRDIMTDKAWVYRPEQPADPERPFLIPSALQVKGGKLGIGKPDSHYHPGGLPHIKVALVKAALGKWDDPVLGPFRQVLGERYNDRLKSFVAVCAVYFLAGALGGIRKHIKEKYPGFGEHAKDYMAVNLAIPIADAQHQAVNDLYYRVLDKSWNLADHLAGHCPIKLTELVNFVPGQRQQNDNGNRTGNGPCFIYPEVSATVQGFVRSRMSGHGIYFFVDTGAATVDQSIFILRRVRNEDDLLTYLHASVLPLGSSLIEQKAAEDSGNLSWESLENWRKIKESGGNQPRELALARKQIGEELREKTVHTIWKAREKLNIPQQLEGIGVLFGGGGHEQNPYKEYIIDGPISAFQLLTDKYGINLDPRVMGMPCPNDLEPSKHVSQWISRLWVAYGLSFLRSQLAEFKYPSEVEKPLPSEVRPRQREIPLASRKEDC